MERAAHDSRRAARHLPVWALKGVILKLDSTCVIITRTETQSPLCSCIQEKPVPILQCCSEVPHVLEHTRTLELGQKPRYTDLRLSPESQKCILHNAASSHMKSD